MDNTLTDDQKRELLRKGAYACPVPPVTTVLWNEDAWIRFIDRDGKWLRKPKGEYNGECNRTACLRSPATWFNKYTKKFYCKHCGHRINFDNNEEICADRQFALFEGVTPENLGTQFISQYNPSTDQTKGYTGETWYKIIGYASTLQEAQQKLYGRVFDTPTPDSAEK